LLPTRTLLPLQLLRRESAHLGHCNRQNAVRRCQVRVTIRSTLQALVVPVNKTSSA
jgi:hypothetical protein